MWFESLFKNLNGCNIHLTKYVTLTDFIKSLSFERYR